MTNKNGIETKRGPAERKAKAKMAEERQVLVDGENIWDRACDSAGVLCEASVPMQQYRHLIASWAGVRSAVVYAVQILREQQVALRDENTSLRDEIKLLQNEAKTEARKLHKEEKENIGHRVGRLMVEHKSPETLQALVCEEIES